MNIKERSVNAARGMIDFLILFVIVGLVTTALFTCAEVNGNIPGTDESGEEQGTDSASDSDSGGDSDSDQSTDSEGDTETDTGIISEEEVIFDLDTNENDNVVIDDEGALIIDPVNDNDTHLIWIVNTPLATISKIDTDEMIELARYRVGGVDPSRTSVSPNGDAYVGIRNGKGLTKISAKGLECPDTNGDGVITTSTGPDDVLDYGQDDCVLWHTELDDHIRGVAVQVISPDELGDAHLPKTTSARRDTEREFVWAGGLGSKLYKLDGETGEILISMTSPLPIYGLALDGRDRVFPEANQTNGPYLWITGGSTGGGNLAHVDTARCVDHASCSGTVCETSCTVANCSAECDDAIKAVYNIKPVDTYGITVDCKQRVWLGSTGGFIKRFDPFAPFNERFRHGDSNLNGNVDGIAADAEGFIWGAHAGQVRRVDAETFQGVLISEVGAKGIAVDRAGKVWAVPQSNAVHVIEPGPTLTNNAVIQNAVTGLTSPYTYSDMTGVQYTLVNQDPGFYRYQFNGCGGVNATMWDHLGWELDLPEDSIVRFRYRFGKTPDAFQNAAWQSLVEVLPGSTTDSIDIGALVNPDANYLAIEVKLYMKAVFNEGDGCDVDTTNSPRVKRIAIKYSCDETIL
ncbi:MAG: hypothetical protein QNJ97_03810 [Myxococcota bacterium]|nr:hypothetical protein [Myxococcota bacterium]